jgi:gamma-F420-2:alpha-L-glutamate ligase
MHCWLFFHRQLAPDIPEAPEVYRFLEVARRMGIELDVLRPQEFDLVVDSAEGWSALYKGRSSKSPMSSSPEPGVRPATLRWP